MPQDDRLREFEARLAMLKHKMESGLVDRARILREMADRMEAGDAAARKEIKTESHKLRGVAGSYGHHDLTELAGRLEQRASMSPPAAVSQMARQLADLAEAKGRQSDPPPPQPESTGCPREAEQPAPQRRPRAQLTPPRAGAGLRVLAMDDDAVTRRLLLLTLQQVGGFDATIVASAAEALALIAEHRYDLIVSDAMMPDMNGREFARAARAQGAAMPIVILSAASPAELGWAAEPSTNTDRWLRKPFKPTELVRDLLRIAGRNTR